MRGLPMYCALIARLRWPSTISEIAKDMGSRESINKAVKELRSAGFAHISGWKRCRKGSGPFGSVWKFGHGADAPAPENERAPENPRRTRPEMLAFAGALRALEAGPATLTEVIQASGLGRHQAQFMARALRQAGMAYIAAWDGRSPAWILGQGKDASRPAPMSQSVADVRYRARLKAKELHSQMTSYDARHQEAA